MSIALRRASVLVSVAVLIPSIAAAQGGVTKPKPGQGGSVVTGAAGTDGASGENAKLEKCEKPMGAMAVVEPQAEYMMALRRYQLGSPVGLIRMMIQQSNCFIVVERGAGMRNAVQERQLAQAGEMRDGANMGGGQMVPADFILTPAVVFSENNAGGLGAGVGKLFGGAAGAVAGGLKFKEGQTSMLVADARTTVQVAAAEGSTKKADIRAGGALFTGGFGAGAGGYGNTNEGKIIAAAFMDNYNKVVQAVRNDPSLQRNVGTIKQEAAAGGKVAGTFREGDVLVPKIASVKLLASPDDAAKAVATLSRNDELVVIGAEKNGFVNVQGSTSSGWVKVILMQKR